MTHKIHDGLGGAAGQRPGYCYATDTTVAAQARDKALSEHHRSLHTCDRRRPPPSPPKSAGDVDSEAWKRWFREYDAWCKNPWETWV